MEITVYSTKNCGKCKMFSAKLTGKGVAYSKIEDDDKVYALGEATGMMSLPIVEIDGKYYSDTQACKLLKI